MLNTYRLLAEIDKKKEKIRNSPEAYLKKSHQLRKDLKGLADVHSFWLENPVLRERILEEMEETDSRKLRQRSREYLGKIVSAWNYLSKLDDGNGFNSLLNPSAIVEVGELIDPNNIGFRPHRATIKNLKFISPNHIKIPELIDRFCSELKESDYHPVEAAAMAHLEIVGIQPFLYGNKRVARLFQDKILDCYDLPPAFIPSGEGQVYWDLLDQALNAKQRGDLKAQRPFFDYLGGKVNVALDTILDDLK